MSSDLIISYDGTANDDDALALGKILAKTGASVALAYIRHAHEYDPRREEVAQHDARRRLEQGAAWLGDPGVPRHVVFSASTGEGLETVAEAEEASIIVFGSDYRTAPGRAEPGTSAQRLMEGGAVSIAVAAAGLRAAPAPTIRAIALWTLNGDTAARQTADALAIRFGATVVHADTGASADLIVVGSAASAPEGRTALSGSTRSMLNSVRGSVLVVPRGRPARL